jgi:hypothetical protein
MKLSSEVKEDLQDQADQIIYFESAMSSEDKASKAVYQRLVEIYKVAYEAGVKSKWKLLNYPPICNAWLMQEYHGS